MYGLCAACFALDIVRLFGVLAKARSKIHIHMLMLVSMGGVASQGID